ncbi:hypothetical protein BaRGS_00000524 [Batillaria attramentaria]|uniref:Secreted protein n=1 Tax=Batillaria attramentaria TaxID=370345 RepID=A0ABD0M9G2_9CAEN
MKSVLGSFSFIAISLTCDPRRVHLHRWPAWSTAAARDATRPTPFVTGSHNTHLADRVSCRACHLDRPSALLFSRDFADYGGDARSLSFSLTSVDRVVEIGIPRCCEVHLKILFHSATDLPPICTVTSHLKKKLLENVIHALTQCSTISITIFIWIRVT